MSRIGFVMFPSSLTDEEGEKEGMVVIGNDVKREIIETWEEYQRTGLHLTQAEADEWLKALEQGKDMEIPQCHK